MEATMPNTDTDDFDILIARKRVEAGLPPTAAAPGETVETDRGWVIGTVQEWMIGAPR